MVIMRMTDDNSIDPWQLLARYIKKGLCETVEPNQICILFKTLFEASKVAGSAKQYEKKKVVQFV